MKIKLFLARETQYFELGIFSFNSYFYYLTCGFIALTRACNLATPATSLLNRRFELVTDEFKVKTHRFELVTGNSCFTFPIFWKTKNFFQKLKHLFSAENIKIENTSFTHKTVVSEANVETNRMVSTKWTYCKEQSFPVTTLFIWKFCFKLRTSSKELIWCTNNPNVHITTFCEPWGCFFPCEYRQVF